MRHFLKKMLMTGKVHLILDNDLISELESDIYIDNNDIIYLSKDDMTNLFDSNLYEEKTENNTVKLISTCENKIMTIVENENHIFVNGVRKKIRGSLINKDDTYYIPISELQDIYNIELNYINDKKVVDIEFLSKEFLLDKFSIFSFNFILNLLDFLVSELFSSSFCISKLCLSHTSFLSVSVCFVFFSLYAKCAAIP